MAFSPATNQLFDEMDDIINGPSNVPDNLDTNGNSPYNFELTDEQMDEILTWTDEVLQQNLQPLLSPEPTPSTSAAATEVTGQTLQQPDPIPVVTIHDDILPPVPVPQQLATKIMPSSPKPSTSSSAFRPALMDAKLPKPRHQKHPRKKSEPTQQQSFIVHQIDPEEFASLAISSKVIDVRLHANQPSGSSLYLGSFHTPYLPGAFRSPHLYFELISQAKSLIATISPFDTISKHMAFGLKNPMFQYVVDRFESYTVQAKHIPKQYDSNIREPISIDGKTIMLTMTVSLDFYTKTSLKEAKSSVLSNSPSTSSSKSTHQRPRPVFARLGNKTRDDSDENTPPKKRRRSRY